ncbi:uncharacterized protein LOC110849329 isoform X3 [Folsomia candida]|uniref:uncharacterized protein LOC110849329 isoform X3 n=1 Tax=Folsomia candida TaxID=158441 RepID=UPI0016055366|nr:uncharacterized protein LOC110849329 isoform X3 [Folsomia candida]
MERLHLPMGVGAVEVAMEEAVGAMGLSRLRHLLTAVAVGVAMEEVGPAMALLQLRRLLTEGEEEAVGAMGLSQLHHLLMGVEVLVMAFHKLNLSRRTEGEEKAMEVVSGVGRVAMLLLLLITVGRRRVVEEEKVMPLLILGLASATTLLLRATEGAVTVGVAMAVVGVVMAEERMERSESLEKAIHNQISNFVLYDSNSNQLVNQLKTLMLTVMISAIVLPSKFFKLMTNRVTYSTHDNNK